MDCYQKFANLRKFVLPCINIANVVSQQPIACTKIMFSATVELTTFAGEKALKKRFHPSRDVSKWPKGLFLVLRKIYLPSPTTITVSFDGAKDKAVFIIKFVFCLLALIFAEENFSIMMDINWPLSFVLTKNFSLEMVCIIVSSNNTSIEACFLGRIMGIAVFVSKEAMKEKYSMLLIFWLYEYLLNIFVADSRKRLVLKPNNSMQYTKHVNAY